MMLLVFKQLPDETFKVYDQNTYDGPECVDVGFGTSRGKALEALKRLRRENSWTKEADLSWKIMDYGYK